MDNLVAIGIINASLLIENQLRKNSLSFNNFDTVGFLNWYVGGLNVD